MGVNNELLINSDEGTIISADMETYHSGKHYATLRIKPKLDLNPRWKGDLIPKEELIKLYIDERYGIRAIAKKFGINYKVIKARLVYYGIPIRNVEETKAHRKYPNGHPAKRKAKVDEVIRLIHNGLNKKEIASILKVNERTIYSTLKRANCYETIKLLIKLNAVKANIKPIGFLSEKLGHRVRSKWEETVGILLKENSIDYQYEPFFLPLSGTAYLPDFKIGNIIIEVKGQIYDSNQILREAVKGYPEYHFWLISDERGVRHLGTICERSYAMFHNSREISNEVKIQLIANIRSVECQT